MSRPLRPLKPGEEPLPLGAWFTLEAACLQFGLQRNSLHVLLCRLREHLEPPTYRCFETRGRKRKLRLLSERDMRLLATQFPVTRSLSRIRP